VGCKLIENTESKKILIFQNHLHNNFKATFTDEMKNERIYESLVTSRFKISFPGNDEDSMDPNV
jgi:hypothetical protein